MKKKTFLLGWFGSAVSEADFERLYRYELPRVYNYFRYRVGDGQIAEDLTSEAFEKAWKNRHHYRSDLAGFSTWLFTIAQRVTIDYYRKHRTDLPLDQLAQIPDDSNLEDRVQKKADFTRLSVLLSRLSDRDRELVALKYGAGLTNRTIAGRTGLSESNVGVTLHRLMQKLRSEWEKDHE